jgi:hypothetical protein
MSCGPTGEFGIDQFENPSVAQGPDEVVETTNRAPTVRGHRDLLSIIRL